MYQKWLRYRQIIWTNDEREEGAAIAIAWKIQTSRIQPIFGNLDGENRTTDALFSIVVWIVLKQLALCNFRLETLKTHKIFSVSCISSSTWFFLAPRNIPKVTRWLSLLIVLVAHETMWPLACCFIFLMSSRRIYSKRLIFMRLHQIASFSRGNVSMYSCMLLIPSTQWTRKWIIRGTRCWWNVWQILSILCTLRPWGISQLGGKVLKPKVSIYTMQ